MKYKVTCLECESARDVVIVKSQGRPLIDWLDNNPDPEVTRIVSGRKRMDGQWGWQCICGNDDLMTDQERNYIKDWTNPEPREIDQIAKDLVAQRPRFKMKENS